MAWSPPPGPNPWGAAGQPPTAGQAPVPGPAPGWGHAQPLGVAPGLAPQGASPNAVIALVLAVLSWMMCGCFTSIPGAILAWTELQRIESGQSSATGRGLVIGALWICGINFAIFALAIAFYAVIFAVSVP